MSEKHVTKRQVKAVVISDAHLGTYGSKAEQLHAYLKTIQPETLVLNGDIIDAWRFSPSYFPTSHLKVIRYFFKLAEEGTKIIFIPGNHDEIARRFTGIDFGRLKIDNKVVLNLDGKSTWIFHGDVFDVVMHHSKWLAKMGSVGYGILTGINKMVNGILTLFGKKKISLAGKIKDKVKGGQKEAVSKFEAMVARLGIRKGYHYVICGHIHRPAKKRIRTPVGAITYINSGDWVDNMTALEYENGDWHLKHWNFETDEIVEDPLVEEIVSETIEDVFARAFKEILKS
ncbi:UDP-2,3-diacylglucosamine diphosphatase [Natronoflexus pectinivorans]|uniref:UDP-2,3-diacylglucosamine pyrophosphatase LpxH n=1 Tax=Natronoflexus pectinivorans TaxID=682526 RepID=A0A4V2RWW8_9BACT|nr:UDP-2,3-diacylglucosamine diphosphatase [Natronoflexus pectinivorans]TCO10561.1 UDP-2,3-diacylglucosamine pyrophosphatase LpxH [Natronoflexus pectinivorans]